MSDQKKEEKEPGGSTSSVQLADFADSFTSFSAMTAKLHQAYKDLEGKFEFLNRRLEATNLELRQSLAEKDRVSSYLNNILESIYSGVIVVDLQGRISLFNRPAEKITGYRAEEVIGKHYREVMRSAEDKPDCLSTLSSGEAYSNEEKQIYTVEGNPLPTGFCTSLLRAPEGGIIGAVEVFFDVSKIKRLEEEVEQVSALAAVGEMAATIAHEVRNPLGGIAGFAALLERDLSEEDPRRRLVGKIIEGVDQLNETMEELLDFTKRIRINPRKTDMVKFLEETVGAFETGLRTKKSGVTIRRGYGDTPLVANFDPELFKRLLLNLLTNAAQAIPESGLIEVNLKTVPRGTHDAASTGAEAGGSLLELEVADTGVGIAPNIKDKIFTPFFSTRESGTGLGLAMVKKIIEVHGGEIEVKSEPGSGSRFVVTLPWG
jgi:PAS domain S-box-containing protein